MATSPQPQTALAAAVNDALKAELGRRDVKPAQIIEWTGRSAQTIRDRRAGRSDWTLSDVEALAEHMGLDARLMIMSKDVGIPPG